MIMAGKVHEPNEEGVTFVNSVIVVRRIVARQYAHYCLTYFIFYEGSAIHEMATLHEFIHERN